MTEKLRSYYAGSISTSVAADGARNFTDAQRAYLRGYRRWVSFGSLDECADDDERNGFEQAAADNDSFGSRPDRDDARESAAHYTR